MEIKKKEKNSIVALVCATIFGACTVICGLISMASAEGTPNGISLITALYTTIGFVSLAVGIVFLISQEEKNTHFTITREEAETLAPYFEEAISNAMKEMTPKEIFVLNSFHVRLTGKNHPLWDNGENESNG